MWLEIRKYLSNVAAPMTSLVYTQMLHPERLLNDRDYLEFHLRELGEPYDRPVVVQLCGNNAEVVVQGARKVQAYCDAVDLNLGCPQEHAQEGHYGAYLLSPKDWPLVESVVSAMSHSLIVPASTKIRLCQPSSMTVDFARRLETAGSSWVALHARHVSARRRRQGAADLEQVKILKENLSIPVISNGNVRTWEDVERNRADTGADGIMVGENLLGNPCLFANVTPDPVKISIEYLQLCREHPDTATLQNMQLHIRHFTEHQCGRKPWYTKFRNALAKCRDLDEIDKLVRVKVQKWRGLAPILVDESTSDSDAEEEYEDARKEDMPDDVSDLSLLE